MPRELLVVDDEPKITSALKALFEEKGFHVSTAPSIQAALKQFHDTPPEVILLDLRLPDGSGLDLLSKLKEQYPSLRAVVISALADQQTIQEAMDRGASSYLTKPFEFDRCFHAAMGIETVDLSTIKVQAEALARVPAAVAEQYHVLPLRWHEDILQVAMADPLDVQRLDELKMLLGCTIAPVAVMDGSLIETIRRCYGVGAGVMQQGSGRETQQTSAHLETPVSSEETTGIVKLVNELIHHAYTNRATDLHIGIGRQGPWVRERIDGMLYPVPLAPQFNALFPSVISRLKVMANLDIAEHRLPQDGRIWFDVDTTQLDLRLSVIPTPHGESLAIRLLEPSLTLRLDELGMIPEQLHLLEPLLAKSAGLLLVTGPTGSGKTTSLYSFLSQLNNGRVNIVTIEDPIEHELPGTTQIQVQPKVGFTFATGLRSIVRHDPDIIMIGEIRDQETAQLAVRAALTGHLVLSTLHTIDAASGITRLLDLGIEPFMLCSTVVGILSQRLLRQLCIDCRTMDTVDAASLTPLGITLPTREGQVKLPHAKGCPKCRHTGYHGRTGVFELLPIDHQIRSLMIKRTSGVQIRQSAISRNMQSLWSASWQKVQAGITSLDELIRVLPPELR